jgi:hypothetical protein
LQLCLPVVALVIYKYKSFFLFYRKGATAPPLNNAMNEFEQEREAKRTANLSPKSLSVFVSLLVWHRKMAVAKLR